MIVQICGSWRPKPGTPGYKVAYQLGAKIAEAGHTVFTGAYSGVMEAASHGAFKAGGQTIGVTCPELDKILKPNQWVIRQIKTKSMSSRLCKCIELADAFIFLPGRSGTVSELALSAEMRNKGLLAVPLILYTEFWVGFFEWLDQTVTSLELPADSNPPSSHVVVYTPEEAMDVLNKGDN